MTHNPAPITRPTPQSGTVPPRPVPHAERRPREYLTPKEVERLITAARQNRYGHRDATMIRVAYRHGLRVSELCALRWDQVDFEHGLLHVRRIKNGRPSVPPLSTCSGAGSCGPCASSSWSTAAQAEVGIRPSGGG